MNHFYSYIGYFEKFSDLDLSRYEQEHHILPNETCKKDLNKTLPCPLTDRVDP